jgi:predicted ThiF/HesA family dinucleotide-utilizing enzyme
MIVSLCTQLYNPVGNVILTISDSTEIAFLSRRLSRVATLDGGAVIVDNGFSPSDGAINLVIDAGANSLAVYKLVADMIKSFGMVTVSTVDGVFLAALESITNNKTRLVIKLLIKSQLA